jgi:hypothetical protein
MISLNDALARFKESGNPYPADKVTDRGSYWFVPPPEDLAGSRGTIIDKEDGHCHTLGSGFPLDRWFWAHERGIKHHEYTLIIDEVFDREATAIFLQHRIADMDTSAPYATWQLGGDLTLPRSMPFVAYPNVRLWRYIPDLFENAIQRWFRYHLIVRSCHDKTCTRIGQVA